MYSFIHVFWVDVCEQNCLDFVTYRQHLVFMYSFHQGSLGMLERNWWDFCNKACSDVFLHQVCLVCVYMYVCEQNCLDCVTRTNSIYLPTYLPTFYLLDRTGFEKASACLLEIVCHVAVCQCCKAQACIDFMVFVFWPMGGPLWVGADLYDSHLIHPLSATS